MHNFLDKIITSLGSIFVANKGIEVSQKGKVARTIISLILTIIAVLLLLFTIYTLVEGLFTGRVNVISLFSFSFGYALMMLAVTLVTVAALLILVQIVLYHARSIAKECDTAYTASSILCDVLRMFGEAAFVLVSTSGVIFFLASLGSGGHNLVPGAIGGGSSVVMGILALIIAPVLGVLSQLIFYFLAERVKVFIDIAENTKK